MWRSRAARLRNEGSDRAPVCRREERMALPFGPFAEGDIPYSPFALRTIFLVVVGVIPFGSAAADAREHVKEIEHLDLEAAHLHHKRGCVGRSGMSMTNIVASSCKNEPWKPSPTAPPARSAIAKLAVTEPARAAVGRSNVNRPAFGSSGLREIFHISPFGQFCLSL